MSKDPTVTAADLISVDHAPDLLVEDGAGSDVVLLEAADDAALSNLGAQAPGVPAAEQAGSRDQPLADLEARLAAADTRLGTLATLLDSTGTRAQAAEAAAVAARSDAAATRAEVDVVKGAATAEKAAAAAITAKVDALAERLTAVDTRLAELGGLVEGLDGSASRFEGLVRGLDERVAENDGALADVHRTIAVQVEQYTSDALVESQQSLQLAVNSIAQLALAMAESSRDLTEDVSAESATVLLDSFRVDLDAILAQLGFEPLQTAVGETFDPHRHRALKRVATADPLQDKAVNRVIRDGYRNAETGRILLFADVEVSRYRA